MKTAKPRAYLIALAESSVLIAVGFALSYITLIKLPQGGSVTPLSMLPILMIGLRHGPKWGLGGGFAYACLQMLQQFWPPPTATVAAYISVILLDYVFAFTILGLSGFFRGMRYGLVYAAPVCLFLRFMSHFVSGIVVWGVYAGELPVWLYSLTYNGSFMGIELLLVLVAGIILCKTAPILFSANHS